MHRTDAPAGYRGPLKALLLDWAGTVIDYGSRAPTATFIRVFSERGVEITAAEARGPMGMAKRAHIETILRMPGVAKRWHERHGRAANDADVDQLYAAFLPLQLRTLADYAELIPGAAEAVSDCRARGLKIGSSTGYVREMMDILMPLAERQGYRPDAMVCASDLTEGRPAPWLNLENARQLGVYPPAAIVVADDTIVGIEAARNAGMWAVGVTRSGNEVGLSAAELSALPADRVKELVSAAAARFTLSGAHYTLESVADLIPVIDDIERRLASGEQP